MFGIRKKSDKKETSKAAQSREDSRDVMSAEAKSMPEKASGTGVFTKEAEEKEPSVLPWIIPDEQKTEGSAAEQNDAPREGIVQGPAKEPVVELAKEPVVDLAGEPYEESAVDLAGEPAGKLAEKPAGEARTTFGTMNKSESSKGESWAGKASTILAGKLSSSKKANASSEEPGMDKTASDPQGKPGRDDTAYVPLEEPGMEGTGSDFDEEPEEERKKHGPVFIWARRIFLTILSIAATFVMTFAFSLWTEFSNNESTKGNEITVEIPKGTKVPEMAEILQGAGVIKYRTPFIVKVVTSDYRGKLKYGTYKLNDGDCLSDILKQLSAGSNMEDANTLLIPEGYSAEMIGARLEEKGVTTSKEFLAALEKAAVKFKYADELPEKGKVFYQLQGYLFPDTYQLSENMTAEQIVDMMLDNFDRKFGKERRKQAKELGIPVEEVLIRASMVQKESDKKEDYPTIAGVINNRLKKGMKLQFDSTVVYVISKGMYGVDRVTHDDLKVESPYNTYYVKGLPPGPISNPGLAAIDGVLHAKKHKYLFFRSDPNKDDGSNIFTETYEEHNAVSGDEAEGSSAGSAGTSKESQKGADDASKGKMTESDDASKGKKTEPGDASKEKKTGSDDASKEKKTGSGEASKGKKTGE